MSTESPIFNVSSRMHMKHKPPPNVVTLSGIDRRVNIEQRVNALPPIVVTLFGIVTDSKMGHPANAA